jgi:diguanylate cyclase (GGDEF)-like protein
LGLQFSLLPRIARREGVAGVIILVVSYGLIMAGIMARVIGIAIFGEKAVGVMQVGETLSLTGRQAITSLVTTAITTGFSYGYITLVASRTRWQLRQMATVDVLTGAPNRRAFDTEVQHAVSRVRRDHTRLGVALLDLDRFKRVNDTHGHAVGDAVLRHFADVVRDTLRETDFFARIGGEEFVLIVTDASSDSISLAAERIRAALERSSLVLPVGVIQITVSAGAAVSEPGEADFDALYDAADAALYRAKAEGRNRIERAGGPAGRVATALAGR